MKILVTGANGLIGRKVIRLLTESKRHQIFATSQKRIQLGSEVEFFTVNLVYSDLNKVIDTLKPDVLVHCAAMGSPDACEVDRYSSSKINVEVTARLAAACRDYGVHMIFLSTDFIFDGKKGNYTEEDTPSPISYYGETKLDAENSILSLDIGVTIVRTSLVFGYDNHLSRPNIALKVVDHLKNRKQYKLPIDQFRTPTYAEDLASALMTLAEKRMGGVFNISGDQRISVYEFAKQIAATFEYDDSLLIPSLSTELAEPAKRPIDSSLNISKAKSIIDYNPLPLQKSIQKLREQLSNS